MELYCTVLHSYQWNRRGSTTNLHIFYSLSEMLILEHILFSKKLPGYKYRLFLLWPKVFEFGISELYHLVDTKHRKI